MQGKYALASGGWWGLGLGASREKWSWLPEAHNDFIFAIIGEELGLPGTLTILVAVRRAGPGARCGWSRRSQTLYAKLAVAGIAAWILGQACVNIAVVLSLLPVIGVPLPFISDGWFGPRADPAGDGHPALLRAAPNPVRPRPSGPGSRSWPGRWRCCRSAPRSARGPTRGST